MAKKKNRKQKDGTDLSSDEILDSLAEDVGATDSDEDEPVVPAEVEEAYSEAESSTDDAERTVEDRGATKEPKAFVGWPVDRDHGSARDLLLNRGKENVDLADEGAGGGRAINLVLLVLLLATAGVGVWQFRAVSSPEALAAKRAEREEAEQRHLEEQLAKQKKYGVLRIESEPAQAEVFKDGQKIVTTNAETGEEIVGMTPINMMDMDIAQTYKIRLEKVGYEPFEFAVAEHLWTKDTTSGEYKFFKMVEMTPIFCEYWFLYDAKQKRELKFDDKTKCLEHYDDAVAKQVSVTECTCKLPPEGAVPPAPAPGGAPAPKPAEKK